MPSSVTLLPRLCEARGCSKVFTPKPGGYNARYCSKRCKTRSKVIPQNIARAARSRSFQSIKRNPDRYALHLLARRTSLREVRAWLAKYKLDKGCCDCGYSKHSAALQLDHEGERARSISDCRTSIKALLHEIENGKCVVRCANCHSIKTWERKQK